MGSTRHRPARSQRNPANRGRLPPRPALQVGAMQIEVLGLLVWVVGPDLSILVFFVSTLLGAAAAVTVTALGDANIQPAHLMLGFVTIAALANRDLSGAAARALSFPRAGFWLLLTVPYPA